MAYRMAGYSKKFVAEHEQEIRLHQAAKEAFSALGKQKIPKVKEIQAEYDALREKKSRHMQRIIRRRMKCGSC